MADTTNEVGVVVLGMGRSGTSAVTAMFVRAGFFAGTDEDLLPANEANPAGYYENLGVYRANEELFARIGGDWFDPPPASAQLAAREWATPILRDSLHGLVEHADGAPIVVKDPRIGVLLPLWGDILSGRLHPVLVIRDPTEIAQSLYRRDGTPPAIALGAWELHMTAVLAYLDGRRAAVVHYASLLEQPGLAEAIVGAASASLDQALTGAIRADDAAGALAGGLRRNRAGAADRSEQLTRRQLELWEWLSGLESGEQRLEVPQSLQRPSDASLETVRAATSWAGAKAVAASRAALERELADERARRLVAEQRLAELDRRYNEIVASRSWRLTGALRAVAARARGGADTRRH